MKTPQFRMRFRLKAPIRAVFHRGGVDGTVEVPTHAEITALAALDQSSLPNRQVKVEWMGRELEMFARDIRECCQRI